VATDFSFKAVDQMLQRAVGEFFSITLDKISNVANHSTALAGTVKDADVCHFLDTD